MSPNPSPEEIVSRSTGERIVLLSEAELHTIHYPNGRRVRNL